jgi:hypothetical protein
VIGAGDMGADHAGTLHRFVCGAEVVMAADVDEERAASVAAAIPGATSTGDALALIADADAEGVVVASHDSTTSRPPPYGPSSTPLCSAPRPTAAKLPHGSVDRDAYVVRAGAAAPRAEPADVFAPPSNRWERERAPGPAHPDVADDSALARALQVLGGLSGPVPLSRGHVRRCT